MTTEARAREASAAAGERARSRAGKIRGLRWWIIGMICMLTVINYIDRMTL